jgi:glyoxylate reductase
MKIVVTQPLVEPSTTELLKAFTVVVGRPGWSEVEIRAAVADADAIVATPADRIGELVLASASKLRIVANCAVGTDNIDLEACRRRGVVVTNTPGVLTEATADLTWALVLAVTRRLQEGEVLLRSGNWDGWKPTELLGFGLQGKTLGVYGAGRIGTAVARRGEAFGMRVFSLTSRDGQDRFDELLRVSDVLTLHAPLTPETRARFGADELSRMKPGAIFVNTSRGGLHDEEALVRALESGRLGGAGLDVYQHEPRVHPGLLSRSDVVLLPHIGSATVETRREMARVACAEVVRVLRGEAPVNRVA